MSFDRTTILGTLADAAKMKKQMLKAGVKAARVKCTRCEGTLHGRLAGHKNHIRMWCDGYCKRRVME